MMVPLIFPTAVFVRAEACPSATPPSARAAASDVEKVRALVRVLVSRVSPCVRASRRPGNCPLREVSVSFAEEMASFVAPTVPCISKSELLISCRDVRAEETLSARPVTAASPEASASAPAAFRRSTTVPLTVETKVAFTCSWMVEAPVPVTFGAMAFFFSLT